MNNHAPATTATTVSLDAIEEALVNLTAAGITFTEVAGCAHPTCETCAPRLLANAA